MENKFFQARVLKKYPDFQVDTELSLAEGEFFSLLGPSGCGKTTLLRLIAGLEKPETATIILCGREVTGLAPSRRRIGMVFQEYALFPHLSVADNIAYGLRMQNLSPARIGARVKKLLSLFNLESLTSRAIDRLSGGEKQRVALARALAPEPRLLLLDEPFSALDYGLRNKLRGELKKLQKQLGFTCIFVTHQQEEALILSDRIGVMEGGRILQTGTASLIYEAPATRFVAEFVGEANLVRCRVIGETALIELGHEIFTQKVTGNPSGAYWLFIRPEEMICGSACAADLTVAGTVSKVEYLGYMYRLEIATPDYLFKVYAAKTSDRPREGSAVSVGFNFKNARLLPAAEPALVSNPRFTAY